MALSEMPTRQQTDKSRRCHQVVSHGREERKPLVQQHKRILPWPIENLSSKTSCLKFHYFVVQSITTTRSRSCWCWRYGGMAFPTICFASITADHGFFHVLSVGDPYCFIRNDRFVCLCMENITLVWMPLAIVEGFTGSTYTNGTNGHIEIRKGDIVFMTSIRWCFLFIIYLKATIVEINEVYGTGIIIKCCLSIDIDYK